MGNSTTGKYILKHAYGVAFFAANIMMNIKRNIKVPRKYICLNVLNIILLKNLCIYCKFKTYEGV